VCASSAKASIKTVTFSTNGSTSLSDIQVLSINDKQYEPGKLPTWGFEKVTGYTMAEIHVLWGLVNNSAANSSVLETRTAEKIYLPAAQLESIVGVAYDTFASGTAFTAAWNDVFESAAVIPGLALDKIPSYSGEKNYGLTLKWRQMSQNATGMSQIFNLIWTDIVASAVVGTRTGFEAQRAAELPHPDHDLVIGFRDVYLYERRVVYTDYRYAIPIFIALAFLFVGLILLSLICCFQASYWFKLNHYVNQTSMGRSMTQLMGSAVADSTAKTKEWCTTDGKLILNVPTYLKRPKYDFGHKSNQPSLGGELSTLRPASATDQQSWDEPLRSEYGSPDHVYSPPQVPGASWEGQWQEPWQGYPAQSAHVPTAPEGSWQGYAAQNAHVPDAAERSWQGYAGQNAHIPDATEVSWEAYPGQTGHTPSPASGLVTTEHQAEIQGSSMPAGYTNIPHYAPHEAQ
jgi:hypothetical protein